MQMPDLGATGSPVLPQSEYFLELINGAAAAADEAGYALVVTPSAGNVGILHALGIDGAIIVDPQGDESLFATGAPVVMIGVAESRGDDALAVDNDHAKAAHVALDHFAEQGRRRPALVVDDTHRSYVENVSAGYRSWVRGRKGRQIVMTLAPLEKEAADRVLAELADARADAVYTSSDDIALALLDAAARAGRRVPQELAIASAVDSRSLTLTSPQISATNLYPLRAGATAAKLVIERLESGPGARRTQMIPTRFVFRASTAGGGTATPESDA